MTLWDLIRVHIPGLPENPTAGENRARCPFHKDGQERHPSFSVNGKTLMANCKTCGEGWSVFQLLRRFGVDPGPYTDLDPNTTQIVEDVDDVILPEELLAIFRLCPVYMLEHGFRKDVLQAYEVGYDRFLDRVTFPVRDIDGNLRAVSGKILDGSGRYKVYKEELANYWPQIPRGYKAHNHDHLWNGHRCRQMQEARGLPFVVVVEGFKAALWVIQAGYPNVVATMGCEITRKQMSLLRGFDCPVVWFLDNDDAGRRALPKVQKLFGSISWCTAVQYPGPDAQPDGLSPDEVDGVLDLAVSEFRGGPMMREN